MSTQMQLAEDVKYMKPITMPDGSTIEVPIKKTPYEMYGPPLPSGLELTDATIAEKAEKIAADAGSHVIRYIRRAPAVAVRTVKVDDDKSFKQAYVAKGHPYGVLLAFKDGDKLLVGWSQHNQAIVDEESGERLEKLPFTRQDALKVAAMRALADEVIIKKKSAFTSGGQVLPDNVCREMKTFVERAERYYKLDAANVSILG